MLAFFPYTQWEVQPDVRFISLFVKHKKGILSSVLLKEQLEQLAVSVPRSSSNQIRTLNYGLRCNDSSSH